MLDRGPILRFLRQLGALAVDEAAPTAAEYAILAASIAVVIVATVGAVGGDVLALFQRVVDAWPR